jgi:hypothetical protein
MQPNLSTNQPLASKTHETKRIGYWGWKLQTVNRQITTKTKTKQNKTKHPNQNELLNLFGVLADVLALGNVVFAETDATSHGDATATMADGPAGDSWQRVIWRGGLEHSLARLGPSDMFSSPRQISVDLEVTHVRVKHVHSKHVEVKHVEVKHVEV